MHHRSVPIACVSLFVLTSWLSAEEKNAAPRENLKTAIPHAIKMLEEKDYQAFMEQFVPPMHFEKLKSSGMFEDIVKRFGEQGKAERLLGVLKQVKDAEPEINSDKTLATFKLKEVVGGKDKIVFEKVEKFWYISN